MEANIMKHMNINFNTYYFEAYIPKRCRKVRYEEKRMDFKVPVRRISSNDAPIAFKLSDYHHVSEHTTEIRSYKGCLYIKYRSWDGKNNEWHVDVAPEELSRVIKPYFTVSFDRTKELCLSEYKNAAKDYLIIDNVIWVKCGEPRYEIITFGLGHNHGGTGLFVGTCYNPNISKDRYFSALNGKEAVDKANQIAERRGDTNDIGTFKEMIKVIDPKMVKLKPLKEHSDGDETINTLNAITENSSSAAEAGLLSMCFAFAGALK